MHLVAAMRLIFPLLVSLAVGVAYADSGSCLVDPLKGILVSSQYGKVRDKLGGSVHQGYDLVSVGSNASRNIYASAEGEIVFVGFRGGAYGNMIVIKRTNAGAQNGNLILHKHVKNSFKVKKGDIVKPGQHIGYYSGTKNSRTDDSGYAPHLHFEYMAEKNNAQQYEYHQHRKTVIGKFANHKGKGFGDRVAMAFSSSKYYTDPTPYLCNDWKMQYPSETGFGFKTVREQYNFILAKLGKSGFEVGGVPNNVVNGSAPGTEEYSIAMGCAALEQALLSPNTGSDGNSGASSPQGAEHVNLI